MSYFYYDSDRTLKIGKEFNEKVNEVQNIQQAVELLKEVSKEFLAKYDSLAQEVDRYERDARNAIELEGTLRKSQERAAALLKEYAMMQFKYNLLLEQYIKLANVNIRKEFFEDVMKMQEKIKERNNNETPNNSNDNN